MRELIKAMADIELQLQNRYQLSFNEAMTLCCISCDTLTASRISENVGLSNSNMSKVLRSMENKELITRSLGSADRRQMCFTLTEAGCRLLQTIKKEEIDIPDFIRPLFQ